MLDRLPYIKIHPWYTTMLVTNWMALLVATLHSFQESHEWLHGITIYIVSLLIALAMVMNVVNFAIIIVQTMRKKPMGVLAALLAIVISFLIIGLALSIDPIAYIV